MPWVAGAIAGSAVLGAGAQLYGSSQSSGAAKDAAGLQLQMFNQNQARSQPFVNAGSSILPDALALAQSGPNGPGGVDYLSRAAGMVPGRMTQAELEQTPGYQFDLAQGLKAVQSSAAARGLGVSGAALKGAGAYATGLANKTYLDQFNVGQKRFEDTLALNTGQQGNLQNQWSRINALGSLGANAASGVATQGTSAANAAGGFERAAGLADAAGTTGAANALSSGVNSYLGYQNYQDLMNRYGTGGSGSQLGGYTPGAVQPNTFETGNFAFGGQ